jgi:hypothetical protein
MVSILILKKQANRDRLISTLIDNIVYYLITSLFYFKLDRDLDQYKKRFIGLGRILYSILVNNLAFLELIK